MLLISGGLTVSGSEFSVRLGCAAGVKATMTSEKVATQHERHGRVEPVVVGGGDDRHQGDQRVGEGDEAATRAF